MNKNTLMEILSFKATDQLASSDAEHPWGLIKIIPSTNSVHLCDFKVTYLDMRPDNKDNLANILLLGEGYVTADYKVALDSVPLPEGLDADLVTRCNDLFSQVLDAAPNFFRSTEVKEYLEKAQACT